MAGNKVIIIGVGLVGAHLAYTLVVRRTTEEVVLIDVDEKRLGGDILDISHGLPYIGKITVKKGSYEDVKDASIIVLTAGAAQKPGETRLNSLKRNIEVFRNITEQINRYKTNAILLVVTNPVDVLTYAVSKFIKTDENRVIGTGTTLDSARARELLSQHCQVDPRNIHAYVLGEHGDSSFIAWSHANVGGIRFNDSCPVCHGPCEMQFETGLIKQVREMAYKIIKNKGATYYGIAVAAEKVITTILNDQNSILTVSSYQKDVLRGKDLALSTPVVVNREGVVRRIPLRLDENEQQLLQYSASIIRGEIEKLGL